MLGDRLVLDQPISLEESLYCEFKEVKGQKPVKIIKNTADEYVVAYLNSQVAGSIFWGIRDSNASVVGVNLNYQERDSLRKDVVSKLLKIQPAISPSAYNIDLHNIFQRSADKNAIPDTYVVEVAVPEITDDELYFTGGNEAFIKTDAGKSKLSGPLLKNEILRRLINRGKLKTPNDYNKNTDLQALSPAMRRAKFLTSVCKGSQLLWVDDNPGNNIYERMTLKSLGISVDIALSSDEAMNMLSYQMYDAIISDMKRDGNSKAGLKFLRATAEDRIDIPLVFYLSKLDEKGGIPPGALGISKFFDELLHLIMDILERRKF
ncbi:RNA-binding domain-containing protein [Thermodesulfobacteriota bacterium]